MILTYFVVINDPQRKQFIYLGQSADGLALDPAEKLLFYSFLNSHSVMVRDYDGLTDHVVVNNAEVGSAMDVHWRLKLEREREREWIKWIIYLFSRFIIFYVDFDKK